MLFLQTGNTSWRDMEGAGGIDRDSNQSHQHELEEAEFRCVNCEWHQQLCAALPAREGLALRRWEISADGGKSEPEICNATQVGSCRAVGGR